MAELNCKVEIADLAPSCTDVRVPAVGKCRRTAFDLLFTAQTASKSDPDRLCCRGVGFGTRVGTLIAITLLRTWLLPASFVRPDPCLASGGFFVGRILAAILFGLRSFLLDRGATSRLVMQVEDAAIDDAYGSVGKNR